MLLLYLFAKSITLPKKDAISNETIYNDPDDPDQFKEFTDIVGSMFVDGISAPRLKAISLLDPVGPSVRVGTISSNTDNTLSGSTIKYQEQTTSDLGWIGTVTSVGDGQYHLGNEVCNPDPPSSRSAVAANEAGKASDPSVMDCRKIHLYRVYAQQLALCVDTDTPTSIFSRNQERAIYPPKVQELIIKSLAKPPTNKSARDMQLQFETRLSQLAITNNARVNNYAFTMAKTPAKGGGGAGGGGAGAAGGGGQSGGATGQNAGSSGTSSALSQLSDAVSINRVSSIMGKQYCAATQLVLEPQSEEQIATASASFSQVDWRSPSELMEYLGALVRAESDHNPKRTDEQIKTMKWIFDLETSSAVTGYGVAYNGLRYRADTSNARRAIDFLSDLVNVSKSATGLPSQLQVLP